MAKKNKKQSSIDKVQERLDSLKAEKESKLNEINETQDPKEKKKLKKELRLINRGERWSADRIKLMNKYNTL
jgi:predicted nuclease with TOPRIM domain